jgi:uncharacterized FlaG/YvyC family protein
MEITPNKQAHQPNPHNVEGGVRPSDPPRNTSTEPLMREYSVNELREMAKAANAAQNGSRVRFKVREDQPPLIVIVDPETNEVIKQIPPEEIQNVKLMIESVEKGENYIINFIDRYA